MNTEHIGAEYDDIQAIEEQGTIVRAVAKSIHAQTSHVLDVHPSKLRNCRRVFITGCGDSYYAALAVEWHLQNVLGRPIRAVEALEFSRYSIDGAEPGDLLIAISNSGSVARTVEAATAAAAKGLFSIAITGNRDSDLAKSVEVVLIQKVRASELSLGPKLSSVLGLGNYLASLTSLLSFVYALAEEGGGPSQATAIACREQLGEASAAIEETFGASVGVASEWASRLQTHDHFFVLGGGPNYATALFAAAKFFEQPRRNAVPIQLEEFAHEQFFLVQEGTPVSVIAPSGRSADRALEVMSGIKDMGGILLVTGPAGNVEARNMADGYFPVPDDVPEYLSPIPYSIPQQLFAAVLGKQLGRTYTSFASENQKVVNFRLIFDSAKRVVR